MAYSESPLDKFDSKKRPTAWRSTASLLLTLIYRADRLRKLLHVTLALLGAEIILLAALAILICIQ